MLFNQTEITTLYSLSNERFIFEGVHHSFKFCLLVFNKGGKSELFNSAFRINPREAVAPNQLDFFLNGRSEHLQTSVSLTRRLSPASLSITEFRDENDVRIAEKMLHFPLLSDRFADKWNLILTREFDINLNKKLLRTTSGPGRIPLFTGKMFNQFALTSEHSGYWIEEEEGKKALPSRTEDTNGCYDYQKYRWVHRRIARGTDSRTLISTIAPKNVFTEVNSTTIKVNEAGITSSEMLLLCGFTNSLTVDWLVRQKVSTTLNMFYIYQLPVPRLTESDPAFAPIAHAAARLICTTPEFDDLAQEVGLGSYADGATDPAERARLRAELDGRIAHLYGLTEDEFAHILRTFPLVAQPVKDAALDAYRALGPSPDDAEIVGLIKRGESAELEFKSSARWDMRENKKNREMEQVIVKTVAAFLNSNGGTLLIGVADDGTPLGLADDFQTLGDKKNLDGYELFLTDLLLNAYGKDVSAFLRITFGQVGGHDICKILIKPSPKPIWIEGKDGAGQKTDQLFIRTGNSSRSLTVREATEYAAHRWK